MDNNLPQAEATTAIDDVLFHTVTFRLNEQSYAVEILHIRDIVMGKTIYCIPNSDPILLGVVNLRGEIIPVYSLKAFLGIEEQKHQLHKTIIRSEEDEYLIIMKIESRLFAIAVDHIHKNIAITAKNFSEGSYMDKWHKNTIFTGVIIDEDENILMTDIPALLKLLLARNLEKTK
ncbi:MAG: chemotaxis protein CheW [Brevinema sp.]